MAPAIANGAGIAPQIIDSVPLRALLDKLVSWHTQGDDNVRSYMPTDVEGFVQTLETSCQTWTFEEQVDLYEWIHPLNMVDAILSQMLEDHPSLLLVAPLKRTPNHTLPNNHHNKEAHANSLEDINTVPDSTRSTLSILLRFLSSLLGNSTNTSVFNSTDQLLDLLAAADDDLADLALTAVSSLATPPALHKQQSPDMPPQHNMTGLQRMKNPQGHGRVLHLARGWGSRGAGLGLLACVEADDSQWGQGALPVECGELCFEYYHADSSRLVTLELSADDMVSQEKQEQREASMDVADFGNRHENSNKQKRRRMGFSSGKDKRMKSTAELFFECLEQAGGRSEVPEDRQFALLADIRLAWAFHSQDTRIRAVERRLRALMVSLYTHPSQDIMSGYFQAQPELCAELTDLLRPTVSSSAVSAASAAGSLSDGDLPALSALANSPGVPYPVRGLALETLTALIARRDMSNAGSLTGVARLTNVLVELGVGKGLYLGILPTLIRYSLASLHSYLAVGAKQTKATTEPSESADAIGMNLGKAFVLAAKAPSLPASEQLHRALGFIDGVLSLTSTVISTPSGTAALTECGLVPALLSTVSLDVSPSMVKHVASLSSVDFSKARVTLRLITSQAIQILEGAVVTHNNAFSAFQELRGVDVLVSRLDADVKEIRRMSGVSRQSPSHVDENAMDLDESDSNADVDATEKERRSCVPARTLSASKRILLFSVINCLTVIFHQESSSTTPAVSPGGTQLRKPELTGALLEILENVVCYGGTLVALVSSLLADIMNSDPQMVHYVHESGLAKAFLRMLVGAKHDEATPDPNFPTSPELIMAIPNVLSALALTESGANALLDDNPFPAFLSMVYSPRFCMPESRSLLNELTAMLGTGLDEMMRHVPKLKPCILSAILKAMSNIADIGERLLLREEENYVLLKDEKPSQLEKDRSAVMQFVLNAAQLLEQIVHNEDHCEPFVNLGGLEATLRLFPIVLLTNTSFLAHVSCLSCHSTCTLAHSTTEDSLLVVVKSMALHCDSALIFKKVSAAINVQLEELKRAQSVLRRSFSGDLVTGSHDEALDADRVLEGLPPVPLHEVESDDDFMSKAPVISKYFRSVVIIQWYTSVLTSTIRAALTRSLESGSDWGRTAWAWKNELTSASFTELFGHISLFHQSALLESCRIRTESAFEERERVRVGRYFPAGSIRYRLRIVCQEGAVIRDGIEIDSCSNIGAAEFGEIVEAVDRCHNSSGVLRYRTRLGWISELTRGHCREPIAEVLHVWSAAPDASVVPGQDFDKRKELGVSDLRSTGASVLARLQHTYTDLNAVLSRVVAHGVKALPARQLTFVEGSVGQQVAFLNSLVSSNLRQGFTREPIKKIVSNTNFDGTVRQSNSAGAALYLGVLLSIAHSCLIDDKRDRATTNVLLLISLMSSDHLTGPQAPWDTSQNHATETQFGLFSAIQFVFKQCLSDICKGVPALLEEKGTRPQQTVRRNVAASLPPTMFLLRKLLKTPLITSNAMSTLKRLSGSEVLTLAGSPRDCPVMFEPVAFARWVYCTVSEVSFEIWTDDRFRFVPVQLAWPFAGLVGEVIASLDQSLKGTSAFSTDGDSRSSVWNIFSRALPGLGDRSLPEDDGRIDPPIEEFEASEEAITLMAEMGFSRDHALDALESTGSNIVEVAMEYALSHPPPNPEAILRRRTERESRRQRRVEIGSEETSQRELSGSQEASSESYVVGGNALRETVESNGTDDSDSGMHDDGAAPTKAEEDKIECESHGDGLKALAERYRQSWIVQSPDVILNLLSDCERQGDLSRREAPTEGNGDKEALTIAMNSVLVEFCVNFPDHRNQIVSSLLDRLKSEIIPGSDKSLCSIRLDRENSFAYLCHATVLISRELPRTRLLVLEKGIVSMLVDCLEGWTATNRCSGEGPSWPIWFAPTLLLLDIMAQPIVAFPNNPDGSPASKATEGGELRKVREEHMQLASRVAETGRILFPCQSVPKSNSGTDEPDAGTSTLKSEQSSGTMAAPLVGMSLMSVPPLAPLLDPGTAERCLDVCINVLQGGSTPSKAFPPPGSTHAILLLISRLVRAPELASKFLQTGGTELILSLPRDCRFNGSSGLVSILLRRLLEDSTMLQAAMETEIRSVMSKLKQQQRKPGTDTMPSVALPTFFRALKALICREPIIFLKAASVTVRFNASLEKQPSVVLLSPTERVSQRAFLVERIPPNEAERQETPEGSRRPHKSVSASLKISKEKNHRRGSPSRRPVPSKKARSEQSEMFTRKSDQYDTPSSQIISVLMSRVVSLLFLAEDSRKTDPSSGMLGNNTSFLWIGSILEVMSDLVLAFPACAGAIHRCRPAISRGMISHGLADGQPPPRTFVNLLLHRLLPQDRQSFKKDPMEGAVENESTKAERTASLILTRVSQTAARLLVSLVARSGEGRRRVLADLASALSGSHHIFGTSVHPFPPSSGKSLSGTELDALQAWGDLCIGFAAPRSNGVNYDSNACLSFEMIKAMLDMGIGHALVYALHRVDLQHPKAPSTCASLVVPLEVFTRSTVTDAVQLAAVKEDEEASNRQLGRERSHESKTKTEGGGINGVLSQPGTSAFADDTMLEDGFDAETAARSALGYENGADPSNGSSEENTSDGDADLDVVMEEADEEDAEERSSEESSEEVVSSDEEDVEEDVEESQGDSGDQDTGNEESSSDESSDSQEDEPNEMEGVQDDIRWSAEDFFDVGNAEPVDTGADRQEDPDLDEGWTRVESGGLGDMILNGGQTVRSTGGPGGLNLSIRTRGFIDAAEAMIGSLLQHGEIEENALAELEGSLGIRMVSRNGHGSDSLMFARRPGLSSQTPSGWGIARDSRGDTARGREMNIGAVPHIRQRGPPEIAMFVGGGSWNESSVEHVYGGISAGNRNYDTVTPLSNDENTDLVYPSVATQLFPGGPAASTHSRTQLTQHPLLTSVELPAINSLVSDLRPHDERAAQRDLTGGVRRGELYSSYYPSSSNGHSNAGSGALGWTDDGLPLDGTLDAFSSAFELAIGDYGAARSENRDSTAPSDQIGSSSTGGVGERTDPPDENESRSEQGDDVAQDERELESDAGPAATTSQESQGFPVDSASEPAGSNDEAMESTRDAGDVADAAPDGDHVASSLVSGLRLSPRSESPHRCNDDASLPLDGLVGSESGIDSATDPAEEAFVRRSDTTGQVADPIETSQHNDPQDDPGESNSSVSDANGVTCPPGMDLEVFNSLPPEMQREVVSQQQTASEVAAQLDSASGLDPEALAALPEEMRLEVIEQEQRERRQREAAPADPSNAEEMDNASFLASLAPDLREEILLTADQTFLNSLPPNIVAEAQIIRDRASARHRQLNEDPYLGTGARNGNAQRIDQRGGTNAAAGNVPSSRKKPRTGSVKVECDKSEVMYLGRTGHRQLKSPFGYSTIRTLVRLMYMLSPVRPQKLLQKVFQNLASKRSIRIVIQSTFLRLLNDEADEAVTELMSLQKEYRDEDDWRNKIDNLSIIEADFPPTSLIGAAPEVSDGDGSSKSLFRRRVGIGCTTSIAANLPKSSRGSSKHRIPPVVATRMIDSLSFLTKNVPRSCIDALSVDVPQDGNEVQTSTNLDSLLDLLARPRYTKSSTNLEQLLTLIEGIVSPLSNLPRDGESPQAISAKDADAALALGKEYIPVPHVAVSQKRIELLCSILRNESCKDTAFTKVNAIARRLCRVESNRQLVLLELAGVAQNLGSDASRDLRALHIRVNEAVEMHRRKLQLELSGEQPDGRKHRTSANLFVGGSPSSSVTLASSSSELKLLRVLQTLHFLCTDHSHEDSGRRNGWTIITSELVEILQRMDLDGLWSQLTTCLRMIQVLEGVASLRELEEERATEDNEPDDSSHDNDDTKKLQNSVVGLLSRFLPIIEAFFVVNASATREVADRSESSDKTSPSPGQQRPPNAEQDELDSLVNGDRVVEFVTANRVLLNALVRNNPGLLEKGLRAMVQVSHCRVLLDFDIKRQWFKTQVRRLRQHASRRHGSLRLVIRREHVFEDAYHMLRLRNADEMRGRLHITFRNEEGVDAGGLSREFFGILAKEIFNPNYALFTSTEDGCTFQPNPNSSINPDHLSYFRFVGRIVGKAVADGYLLDAHFTRSLYKHMLGLKPTHHDMEAIDPDYYKNLKMILEYNLADIGLDLNFSIDDHSFGRSQVIDLIPDGRNVHVNEETKAEYVSLVCQHRMTTAISSQIKAYLDGFHELVSKDLIAIFTPKELELLISGLPDIDVLDLKQHTDYHGYKAADKEIAWFWNIMFSLSRNEKASFLQFVTGSSKVPLSGFSELQGMRGIQRFSIHRAGGQRGALMSAHTCFNSLDLPVYESEEEMREKLLYAISEGTGAFLFA